MLILLSAYLLIFSECSSVSVTLLPLFPLTLKRPFQTIDQFHSFLIPGDLCLVLLPCCPPLPFDRLLPRSLLSCSYNPEDSLYPSPMLHESWQEVLKQLSTQSSFLELYWEFLASVLVSVIRSFFWHIQDNLGWVLNFVLASLLAQGKSPYPQPPGPW